MVADADLPVWSIKPNWANGITERLGWLTDVLMSTFGPEQRRALRLSPRREFEMTFNPVDQSRSYFDLWLHRMGSFEFMVPLFHDMGRLTTDIIDGATALPFDTTYREHRIGDFAILIGDDAFTFDKVEISAIADDSITVVADGITRAWPAGTRIYPLRRSRISDESLLAALTHRVGEAQLQFQLNQENDIADEGVWDITYGGYPVISTEPNRRENLDLTFTRNSLVLDNDHGLRVLNDDAGRAFTLQVDNRMMTGRAEHWAFRQMLYRLRGQQGSLWLPTFNRDIELSRDAAGTDSYLTVKKIGYAYTGGAVSGRQYVYLPGGVVANINDVGAEPTPAEEHLDLAAALGAALPAGTFGSFMDTCRLVSDDIEIQHHTDTDGVAECNLGFRSFRDERAIPDPIYYPISIVEETDAACGTPADGEGICLPESGYWGRVIAVTTLGPGIPVIPPWSWRVSLWRGGVMQSIIINADNYTDYDGALNGWTTHWYLPDLAVPRGEAGFAVDPFAAGDPDTLKIDIQWPYGNWTFPVGIRSGSMILTFNRIDGESFTTPPFAIVGLWPMHFEFPL